MKHQVGPSKTGLICSRQIQRPVSAITETRVASTMLQLLPFQDEARTSTPHHYSTPASRASHFHQENRKPTQKDAPGPASGRFVPSPSLGLDSRFDQGLASQPPARNLHPARRMLLEHTFRQPRQEPLPSPSFRQPPEQPPNNGWKPASSAGLGKPLFFEPQYLPGSHIKHPLLNSPSSE